MRLYLIALMLGGGLVAITGCSSKTRQEAAPKPENMKFESAHGTASPSPGAMGEGLTFTPAPGWIQESVSSTSRKAQYKLPRAEGDTEDAELAVHHFQGGGGSPQANVDRWISQFTGAGGAPAADTAKISRRNVDGIPLTIVDVSGSYTNSMQSMTQPAGAKANFRMLGAIAEAGNGPWFIKLTGPAKTVAKWAT